MSDPDHQLWQVMDAIPTLAWSARPDGSADFFNLRWLNYTGLSREQAVDWGWKGAIHPDDLPHILEMFRDALKSGTPFEAQGRLRRSEGEFRCFLFRASPLLDKSGQIVRWYGTNTDLEDHRRADDALRICEARWKTPLENSSVGIALTDMEGNFEITNGVYQRLLGYSEEELQKLSYENVTHEEDLERSRALFRQLVEGKFQQLHAEKRCRRKDGSVVWTKNSVSRVLGDEGKSGLFAAVVTDITERKRAEDALRRSEAYLTEAQKLSRTEEGQHSGSPCPLKRQPPHDFRQSPFASTTDG